LWLTPVLPESFSSSIFGWINGLADINKYVITGKVTSQMIIFIIGATIIFALMLKTRHKHIWVLSLSMILPRLIEREEYYITFINVGQGDSTFIKGDETYMIDTGGSIYKDVATEILIPYLKYEGISQIDNLYITHDDFDHNGSYDSLLSNFKVIGDGGEDNLLPLNKSDNDNDNSKVFYKLINGFGILLLGDISKNKEIELMNKYQDLKIDIIKVGHHGSNTSTSEEFYSWANPEVCILSYGRNFYGHPTNEVVRTLSSYCESAYHTYLHGAIKINLNTFKIEHSNML
jgi:competence protein ComEC